VIAIQVVLHQYDNEDHPGGEVQNISEFHQYSPKIK